MFKRIPALWFVACILLFLAAAPAVGATVPAPPYQTNSACIECHDVKSVVPTTSRVAFDVPPTVSLEKCKACHAALPDLVPSGGALEASHYHGVDCRNCHNGEDGFFFPVPVGRPLAPADLVQTNYGFFVATTSLSATPATLHSIHSGNGWIEQLFADGVTGAGDGSPYMSSKLGVPCASCHAAAACDACHEAPITHGEHGSTTYPPVTIKQANGSSVLNTPSSCINPACHALAVAGTPAFTPSCEGCHLANVETHGYDGIDHVADDGALGTLRCSSCHALDLEVEHQGAGVGGCFTCHPAPRDSIETWDRSCATGECHSAASSAPMHANLPAAHALPAVADACVSCHPTTDLASLHTSAMSADGESCLVCHTGAVPTNDCTTCHFTFADHYDSAAHTSVWTLSTCGGSGCHATNDLMPEHERAAAVKGETFECSTCHQNTGPDAARYDAAIAAGTTACDACHDGIAESSGHRAVHWAEPALMDGAGLPGYAYYTGSASGTRTSDCQLCHVGNLVDEHMGLAGVRAARADATGAPLDCSTCHESARIEVLSAIAGGVSACDACHPVHGPLWSVHKSGYTPSGDEGCSGCHISNLEGEHNGLVTTLPSGRVLTGCALCHDNTEGDRGAQVQSAIDVTNDTRCAACHTDYHAGASGSHTAVTSESVTGCGACHAEGNPASLDVTAVHANAAPGPCSVCHANPTRVPDLSTRTAECAACHAVSGDDYHSAMSAKHTFSAMPISCVGAGCHASKSLPEAHAPYLSRYPGYQDTCALCHRNTVVGRIDWAQASADCATCHEVHGDIDVIHEAPSSTECVACHESADVRVVHGATPGDSCSVCHNASVTVAGKTAQCVDCHELSPAGTKHYSSESHLASAETGCKKCHSLDMKAEHEKPAVAVTCVQCHETKVDGFANAWDKSCAACHPTKHGQMREKHVSTRSECSGVGCHVIGDASDIHKGVAGGGCDVCHAAGARLTTDCMACHEAVGSNHHEQHNGAAANPGGCNGCHKMYLDDEHASLGYTCGTCHDSTRSEVTAAITTGNRTCVACHPTMHEAQAAEFDPANGSMHRTRSDLPGMRSSFKVGNSTYTWSLPAASSFLKTGWTTSSIVTCDRCHTFAANPSGPHGSSVRVNIDPAYPVDWKTAYLTNSASGMSSTSIICAKCHDLNGANGTWSNEVHREGDHQGSSDGKCTLCHVKIPHGWGRPRLLGYTTDPAPYASTGLLKLKVRSYTPTNWSESDCQTSCGEHDSSVTPFWPAAPTVTGVIAGVVKDAANGTGLSGVTVTAAGIAAVTANDGTYSVAGVPTGATTVSFAKTGYTGLTQNVTVVKGTNKLDVSLAASRNLALGMPFSASRYDGSTYAPSKAGDGVESTYWWSSRYGGSTTVEWLRVDLTASKTVSRAEIVWYGTYNASEFRVYTSTDGSSWSQVYTTTSGVAGTTSVSFSARAVRYVKVECRRTGSGRSNGYGISELRVFEK